MNFASMLVIAFYLLCALSSATHAQGANDPHEAEFLNKLAQRYEAEKDYVMAVSLIKRSLALQETAP